MRKPLFVSFLLPLVACGGPTAIELGPPKRLKSEERPTVWGAGARDRIELASGMPRMGDAAAEPQQGEERQYVGTTPDGWEVLPPQPAKFRNLLWRIQGRDDTECYLSAGVGGGVAGNMARWYRQFGRADVPALESLPVVEMAGRSGRLVELQGQFGGKADQGVLLAFFAEGERVTSLKFTGPKDLVTQQREKFLALAKSLRSATASPNPNAPPIDPNAKMPDGHPAVGGVAPGVGPLAPSADGVKFVADVPSGWEALPPEPDRFREAIWRVTGDEPNECYLSAGVGGGVAGNLMRWYRQFGRLEAPAVDSLPSVALGGQEARLVELEGTFGGKPDQAMLLAFFANGESVTSLKFTGAKALVAKHREEFLQIARTLRAAAPGAGPAASGQQPAPHQPPKATAPGGMPGMTAGSPFTADIPAGWTAKTGSTKPLHHTFGSDGEVYVSELGGTAKQMFDVWRSELGQQPLSDAEFEALPKVPMLGGQAHLLDQKGHYRGMTGKEIADAGMLIAVVQDGGSTVFCKLLGQAADVQAQRAAFEAFCKSLKRKP